jgi:PHD/YefM family antitoxin component YafN of YafNO toxin-antitoxin module
MDVLEVSTRQFRDKQKLFFDLADKGKQIIIKRRQKPAYFLMPVEEDDFEVTPQMLEKYERIRQDVLNGNCTTCYTVEEAHKHFQSL